MPKTKILIEVSGGCVQSVTSTKDIEIFIIDHDDAVFWTKKDCEDARTPSAPDCVCANKFEFEECLEEAINEQPFEDGDDE